MDSGVGSAGSARFDRSPQDDFQPRLKDLLNRQDPKLPLPSVILRAIILKSQSKVSFQLRLPRGIVEPKFLRHATHQVHVAYRLAGRTSSQIVNHRDQD